MKKAKKQPDLQRHKDHNLKCALQRLVHCKNSNKKRSISPRRPETVQNSKRTKINPRRCEVEKKERADVGPWARRAARSRPGKPSPFSDPEGKRELNPPPRLGLGLGVGGRVRGRRGRSKMASVAERSPSFFPLECPAAPLPSMRGTRKTKYRNLVN